MSSRHFYLSAGNLTVTGNRLEDLRFSGTTVAYDFMRLNAVLEPINASLSAIAAQYRKCSTMEAFPGKEDSLSGYNKASAQLAEDYRASENVLSGSTLHRC